MRIHDLRFFSLGQYIKAGRPELGRPRRCSGCHSDDSLWKNGGYEREAREGELSCRVKVPRFKCKFCNQLVSLFLGFLLPYRQYTSKVVAEVIGRYLVEVTSYRILAGEVSSGLHEQDRPSASQVFEWIDDFCRHAAGSLGILVNRACVREGKEMRLGAEARCPNSEIAQSLEKQDRLNMAATVLAEATMVIKPTHTLRRLRAYFLKSVHSFWEIFRGHHSRLSLSQNQEQLF